MRALILGLPKGFWSEDWSRNFVNALPMGVFAIANHCNDWGHDVRIVNAAVCGSRERAIETILRRLDETRAAVVGIPLHWHLAGYDVLRAAEFLKKARPALRIVLGGLTASVYPREILERFPAVDAVIAGDGEVPFCALLDALEGRTGEPDLSGVPNLHWRKHGAIRDNGLRYVASSEQLSALDFSPRAGVCPPGDYANGLVLHEAIQGLSPDPSLQPLDRRMFFMNIGRGCSYTCAYCGGSRTSHLRYTGRDEVTVRSVTSVVTDFERCHAAGFRRFHICFDPAFPNKQAYFEALFDGVRRTIGTGSDLVFESYGLPSRALAEAAAEAFSSVGLIVSPCFFEPAIRRVCKGYAFSDEEMEICLLELATIDRCQAFVYFAVTPREDWSDQLLAGRIERLVGLRRRTGASISVMPVFAEPGSPWVALPDGSPERRFSLSFDDFFELWRQPLDGWNDRLTGVTGIDRVMARFQEVLGPAEA
jgi:hypothetical protein